MTREFVDDAMEIFVVVDASDRVTRVTASLEVQLPHCRRSDECDDVDEGPLHVAAVVDVAAAVVAEVLAG